MIWWPLDPLTSWSTRDDLVAIRSPSERGKKGYGGH